VKADAVVERRVVLGLAADRVLPVERAGRERNEVRDRLRSALLFEANDDVAEGRVKASIQVALTGDVDRRKYWSHGAVVLSRGPDPSSTFSAPRAKKSSAVP
jgi:hypothetical protein